MIVARTFIGADRVFDSFPNLTIMARGLVVKEFHGHRLRRWWPPTTGAKTGEKVRRSRPRHRR
jgi:hypothetical protein